VVANDYGGEDSGPMNVLVSVMPAGSTDEEILSGQSKLTTYNYEAHSWKFYGNTGGGASIVGTRSTTGSVDPELFLYSPSGERLAVANGGYTGDYHQIRIDNVRLPETGWYTVVANDYGGEDSGPMNIGLAVNQSPIWDIPDIKILKGLSQTDVFKLNQYLKWITTASWTWSANTTFTNLSIDSNSWVDYFEPLSSNAGQDTVTFTASGAIWDTSLLKYSSYLWNRLPDVLVDNGEFIRNSSINLEDYLTKDTSIGYPASYPYYFKYGSSADFSKLTVNFSGSTVQISVSSTLVAPAEIVLTATPDTASNDWNKEIIHVYELVNSSGQFTVGDDTTHWFFEVYGNGAGAGTLSWISSWNLVMMMQAPGQKGKLSQVFYVPSPGWYTARVNVTTDIADTTKQQKVYLYLYEFDQNTTIISCGNQVIASGAGGLGKAWEWKQMEISYYASGTILGVQVVGINPSSSGVWGSLYIDDIFVYPAPPQVERCYGATAIPLTNASFDTAIAGWYIEIYGDGTGAGNWSWLSIWADRIGILHGSQTSGQKAKVSQLFSFPNAGKNASASVWVYSSATTQNNTQKVYLYLYSYASGSTKIMESGNGILYAGQWTPGEWRQIKFGYTPMSKFNAVQVVGINPSGNPTQSIYFDEVAVDQDQDIEYYWDNSLF
jgi:hypothetical protein